MIGVAHKEALNISEPVIVASSENKAAQALTSVSHTKHSNSNPLMYKTN